MTTRILTDHAESTTALVEQTQTCVSASRAIAWATPNKVFDAAFANIDKFDRLVVGTYGCHTHPECLEKLGPYPQVSIRRSGKDYALFHPKVYFFEHADHYTVAIDSHNLTAGAFQRDVELSTMTVFAKEEPAADALRKIYLGGEPSHLLRAVWTHILEAVPGPLPPSLQAAART